MAINRNYYQGKSFMTINSLPTCQFFLHKYGIPGMTIGTAEQGTRFGNIPHPGDKISYNALNLSIFVDEDFVTYKELKNWINSNCPTDSGDYSYNVSDMILNILNNNNKSNLQILFKNCFIEQVNDVSIDSTSNDDTEPYILDVLVRFQSWDFI